MSDHEIEYEEEEVEEVVESGDEVEEEAEMETPPTPKKKLGKVTPSKPVRELKLSTPEAEANKLKDVLTPAKNPFTTRGTWSPKTFSEITISFPAITSKNETTNELTRSNKPEARYWKVLLKFSYSTFSSETLRFNNVHIPYHTTSGYGSSFVYVSLPGFMAEMFAKAGKSRRPTVVNESSLVPDANRWWRIANNVEGKFGNIDKSTNKFYPKSLDVIFSGTGKGVTANVVGRFFAKASTDDRSPLAPTVPQRLAFEIDRAYIVSTDVDVQMPTRVSRAKAKVEPLATREDVATDGLMKRLADLGL